MDPLLLISNYYKPGSKSHNILYGHSRAVADKALHIAEKLPQLNPNLIFIEESALLHDIGIYLTNAPGIYCYGGFPYLAHGYLGCDLLTKLGYPDHGLVCERHTGVGISKEEIIRNKLPLPERDLIPESVEEQIIAFADKFFSKSSENVSKEKTLKEVRNSMSKFGKTNLDRFNAWCELFL
ncbi:MAG: HD domain-containing protein [Marinilabiliales bacterium]|nr:HD domain-containing protein [Marinilabiliales bacterium]